MQFPPRLDLARQIKQLKYQKNSDHSSSADTGLWRGGMGSEKSAKLTRLLRLLNMETAWSGLGDRTATLALDPDLQTMTTQSSTR